MPSSYDVIVVGLGAMGSSTAYHLARRGQRVLGLDRFTPPHTQGSSHGQTRIIREAYHEHPLYVPLVQRAYELWTDLEKETGQRLFVKTGGLIIGPPDGSVVRGAQRSAEEHHLNYEVLSSAEVRTRFPALNPSDGMIAIWEPRAGILFPEACVASHLALAGKHGAEVWFQEPVRSWEPHRSGVRVQTETATYEAGRLVLTAGAWIRSLLPGCNLPLVVERQVLYWFASNSLIKGFALVFFIGVITSMFTAIAVSRSFLFALGAKGESRLSKFLFGSGVL